MDDRMGVAVIDEDSIDQEADEHYITTQSDDNMDRDCRSPALVDDADMKNTTGQAYGVPAVAALPRRVEETSREGQPGPMSHGPSAESLQALAEGQRNRNRGSPARGAKAFLQLLDTMVKFLAVLSLQR